MSLSLCNEGHAEVCYLSAQCPACEEKEARHEAEKEADRRVAVVEEKLQDAERRIEDYRTELGI
jgi:hypothetical protein